MASPMPMHTKLAPTQVLTSQPAGGAKRPSMKRASIHAPNTTNAAPQNDMLPRRERMAGHITRRRP
jgi:hypothetical protein